ncbi:hypothetical protein [Streptomyces fagopyri]|uniref:hypothetical protein n=1 Tax=Streptomyces fagopyri TaxID=2662397 RepID=UPI00382F6EA0
MSDTVLRGIAAADHPEEAPPPALRTASEMAQEVARRLGTVLGEPVGAHVWHLAVGYETPETRPGRDMVLLPVRGGCECRGRPVPQQDGGAVFGTPVRLRLRLGEALYLPAHFCYTLAEVHAPCIVIQLVFSGTAL